MPGTSPTIGSRPTRTLVPGIRNAESQSSASRCRRATLCCIKSPHFTVWPPSSGGVMHAGTMLMLTAMLQGNQASSQAVDTVPANLTDSSHAFVPRVVLRSSLLGQFPLDDPREGLTLVPGMVRRGTALGIGAGTGLRLRGGAPDGAAVYIDGAPIRNLMTGVPGATLATNAI